MPAWKPSELNNLLKRRSFLANPEPGLSVRNLDLQTDLGEVDLLDTITGVGDLARVRDAAIDVELFGKRVRMISIDDLIAAKESLARDKDLFVAKELQAIREKQRG